jgi:hypothetical protein
MTEKDWSPEDEVDPIELQKRQLALGEKFMAKLEKEEAEKAKRQAEAEVFVPAAPYMPPPPPTFEERCARIEKAWAETKRLVPDAPDNVKTIVFQTLLHSSENTIYGIGPA